MLLAIASACLNQFKRRLQFRLEYFDSWYVSNPGSDSWLSSNLKYAPHGFCYFEILVICLLDFYHFVSRSSCSEFLFRKCVLKIFAKFAGKHLCRCLSLTKNETPTQVFSCEFWEFLRTMILSKTSAASECPRIVVACSLLLLLNEPVASFGIAFIRLFKILVLLYEQVLYIDFLCFHYSISCGS